jgi:hypothetical protein
MARILNWLWEGFGASRTGQKQSEIRIHVHRHVRMPPGRDRESSGRLRIADLKNRLYLTAAFTSRKYFWYSCLLEAESTPGTLCHTILTKKISDGTIETFRFVAQCHNQLCHRVPLHITYSLKLSDINKNRNDSKMFIEFQKSAISWTYIQRLWSCSIAKTDGEF